MKKEGGPLFIRDRRQRLVHTACGALMSQQDGFGPLSDGFQASGREETVYDLWCPQCDTAPMPIQNLGRINEHDIVEWKI